MQHEDGPAGRDANHERDSNRVHRCDGGLFLQVWQDKPRVYLSLYTTFALLSFFFFLHAEIRARDESQAARGHGVTVSQGGLG
jgi:hypothetical protein